MCILLNILDLSLHTTSFRTICAVNRKTKCMKVGDAHILDSSKRIFALSGLTNAQFYILTRTWLINQFTAALICCSEQEIGQELSRKRFCSIGHYE